MLRNTDGPTYQAQAVHWMLRLRGGRACASVQAHGPGAKRNFPGETTCELPVTVGEKRKQRSSSR
jgi:hypothetical protein